MRRTVISLLACFVAIGPIALPHARAAAPASIDTFFEQFTADWVRADPDLATALRYFSGEEQDRLERQVTPNTREQRIGRIRRAQAGLASLRRFDRKTLTATQNLSADLLESQLETIVRGEAYLDFSFPLDQFQGANVGLVETLTLRHPLLVPRDAENYLARLALLGTRMEESLTDARELATRGFMPPQFILSSTLSSMNSFRNLPPEGNPLVTAYEQRLTAIAGLDAAKRSALKQQAATLVANQVYPAWTHAIAFLDSLVPRATSDAGLWRFRGGEAAYAYSLGRFTTTTLSPEQIHAIGLEQVDKIEKEMDRILRQLGRSDGSVRERIAKLKQDLGYADPTSDASRAQIMRDVDGMMKDAQAAQRAALCTAAADQRHCAGLSALSRSGRGGQLQSRTARRLAARDLPDTAAPRTHDALRVAHAGLSRDDTGTSFPGRPRAGESCAPALPSGSRHRWYRRAERRMGALCRAGRGRIGLVRRRS